MDSRDPRGQYAVQMVGGVMSRRCGFAGVVELSFEDCKLRIETSET